MTDLGAVFLPSLPVGWGKRSPSSFVQGKTEGMPATVLALPLPVLAEVRARGVGPVPRWPKVE